MCDDVITKDALTCMNLAEGSVLVSILAAEYLL